MFISVGNLNLTGVGIHDGILKLAFADTPEASRNWTALEYQEYQKQAVTPIYLHGSIEAAFVCAAEQVKQYLEANQGKGSEHE